MLRKEIWNNRVTRESTGAVGVEPTSSAATGQRFNQLSYAPKIRDSNQRLCGAFCGPSCFNAGLNRIRTMEWNTERVMTKRPTRHLGANLLRPWCNPKATYILPFRVRG